MKLLLLNYEFPPLGAGAGNATKMLAKEFSAMGHSVTVLTTWFAGLPEQENLDGYTIIRVHSRRARADRSNALEMLHYVWCAIRIGARLVKKEHPDHIVSFFALPTGLVAWYFKKRFGVPYTLSLRGGDVPGFLPKDLWLHHILSRPIQGPVWRNASHVVANSNGLQKLAQKTADRYGKIVECIPNGVDTDTYHPTTSKMRVSPHQRLLLFVGRLVRQKGVTYLINALAEIQKTSPDVWSDTQLTIVGDGPLRVELEHEAHKLGVADHIVWKGWMDRKALAEEYRNHDAFVFPSFEEGMPNVVLEAMASGLAIVATNIGGTDEIVTTGQEGLLYDSYDELPHVLMRMTETLDILEGFQQRARVRAERMSWSAVARAYIQQIA